LDWAGWRRPWILASGRGRICYSDVLYVFSTGLSILLQFPFVCFLFSLELSFVSLIRVTSPTKQWGIMRAYCASGRASETRQNHSASI
jgi:hypothetical protein